MCSWWFLLTQIGQVRPVACPYATPNGNCGLFRGYVELRSGPSGQRESDGHGCGRLDQLAGRFEQTCVLVAMETGNTV